MRTFFCYVLLLAGLTTTANVVAQSKKAPARRSTPSQSVSRPATSQSASKPAPKTNVAATGRSNSEKLPQPVSTAPRPAPAQPRRTYATRATPVRTRSAGGLGYQKGDNLLNIGVGLSSRYYGNPIGASFEFGVADDISVGAQLDYNSGNYGDYYYQSSRWRYTATYFGVRGSYHFNRLLNLNTRKADLYAGLGLGYQSFRWNDSRYGTGVDYRSGLFPNYFIGGRYYFTEQIGGFAELGYTGLSWSRVGVAIKF